MANIRGVDKVIVEMIVNDDYDGMSKVRFCDIAGQETAKHSFEEIGILPTIRPDLYAQVRAPVKAILLFGPPRNGKTMLTEAAAVESNYTFLNTRASRVALKWFGEGERIIRALFAVAKELQPTLIFIDEVESLLKYRKKSMTMGVDD